MSLWNYFGSRSGASGQVPSPNPFGQDNSRSPLIPEPRDEGVSTDLHFPPPAHSHTREHSNRTLLRDKKFPEDTEGNEVISLLVDIVCPHSTAARTPEKKVYLAVQNAAQNGGEGRLASIICPLFCNKNVFLFPRTI